MKGAYYIIGAMVDIELKMEDFTYQLRSMGFILATVVTHLSKGGRRSNKYYKSSSELKPTEFPFTQAAERIEGWEQKLEITGGVAVEILNA